MIPGRFILFTNSYMGHQTLVTFYTKFCFSECIAIGKNIDIFIFVNYPELYEFGFKSVNRILTEFIK